MKAKGKNASITVLIDPDEASSTISGLVRAPKLTSDRRWVNCDARLVLSDCSRVITWSLVGHGATTNYRIKKLGRVIKALTKLYEAMVHNEKIRIELEREAKARRAKHNKKNKKKGSNVVFESLYD